MPEAPKVGGNTQPKICVVGSGFVGQATGRGLRAQGFEVVFIDTNNAVIETLRSEGFPAYAPEEARTARPAIDCDLTFLCVPTPTVDGEVSLGHVRDAAAEVGRRLRGVPRYHVVVVRSTVPPGTTEELVGRTVAEHSGKRLGRDIGLCMSPEFLRQRTAQADFDRPWVLVIGESDARAGDALRDLYRSFDCPLHRVALAEAEMLKYVHNLFNAAKISFFNELRAVCRSSGIDAERLFPIVAESAEGMWNPQYGIRDFGPFDGNCLPKDTEGFRGWARSRGLRMPLLDATIQVNEELNVQEEVAPEPVPVAHATPAVRVPVTPNTVSP